MINNLSIIITTFNSSGVIFDCLKKINIQGEGIFVVDNNSSDNTIEIIEKNFPKVNIIKNKNNLGYGRANNIALKKIQTEFALILNPDAFILEKDINKIIELMINETSVAIAAPILLNKFPAQDDDIKNQKDIIDANKILSHKNFTEVRYIIGAIMFLRMNIFKKIGFFDEKIFLYYEDDEICWRAIKNNYKCAIINDIYGFHIGHGSSGSSLRMTYKRFWHKALSKFYWKEKKIGRLKSTLSAIKLALSFLLQFLFYILLFNKYNAVKNIASLMGTIAYILRLSAFNSKDISRG